VTHLTPAAVVLAAIVVVCAEYATRSIVRLRRRYLVHFPGERMLFEVDPRLSSHMEPRVRYETNADGARGAEPPPSGPGTLRIAVIGGSATECYLLDQPTSWPERMAAHLAAAEASSAAGRRAVHVANLGRSEMTTAAAAMVIEHALARHQAPDVVILMVGISDMLRWLKLGTPEQIPQQTASDIFDIHPEGPFSWRPRSMALAHLARRAMRRWRRWREPVRRRTMVGASIVASRARKQNATTILTEIPDAAPMLAAYRRNLTAVLKTLLSRPCRVIFTGQPHFASGRCTAFEQSHFWNGGVGDPMHGPVSTFYSDGVLDALAEQVNATAQEIAAGLGVAYVDLDPVVPSDLEHYYDQFHFTPAGSDKVARAVADEVARQLRA
jgi:lysophospholipase L1-like esterase